MPRVKQVCRISTPACGPSSCGIVRCFCRLAVSIRTSLAIASTSPYTPPLSPLPPCPLPPSDLLLSRFDSRRRLERKRNKRPLQVPAQRNRQVAKATPLQVPGQRESKKHLLPLQIILLRVSPRQAVAIPDLPRVNRRLPSEITRCLLLYKLNGGPFLTARVRTSSKLPSQQ